MNNEYIRKNLELILNKLEGRDINWRLGGSANLKLQRVNIDVRDIDIVTDYLGIKIFEEVLKKYIHKKTYNENIKSNILVCNINGIEVEISHYTNSELNMFDVTKNIFWRNLKVPVLSLIYARENYKLRNSEEKVDLIDFVLQK
jgi:hypothetical protein